MCSCGESAAIHAYAATCSSQADVLMPSSKSAITEVGCTSATSQELQMPNPQNLSLKIIPVIKVSPNDKYFKLQHAFKHCLVKISPIWSS